MGFDSGFDELQVGCVTQVQRIEPLGLAPSDIPGRGPAVGVRVFVVSNQSLPVLITGSLY